MKPLQLIVFMSMVALSNPAALAQGRPAVVETDKVSVREFSETITVFGEVVANRRSAVATRVAGVIAEVPVRIGSRVEQGELLAQLDTERLEIEKARAETERSIADAGVAVAEARLERARLALARAEDLRAKSAIAQAQYEDRVSDFAEANGASEEARARLALAENAVERAMYDIRNAAIRAPFSGVVLEVAAEIGQYANSGSAVATLLDLSSLEVLADIPATYVAALTPGREISASTDTVEGFGLSLRAALPTEYANTRTRPVVFLFDETPPAVAVGQPVTLGIPVGEKREIAVVPKDALVQSGGGWRVFVNQDGTATPREVEIGAAIGQAFEVVSGLQPGDEVVVRGNERLRPGQSIMVAGAGGPPGGGPPGTGASGDGAGGPPPAAGGRPGGPPGEDDGARARGPAQVPARG